jgi:hypothetical protein
MPSTKLLQEGLPQSLPELLMHLLLLRLLSTRLARIVLVSNPDGVMDSRLRCLVLPATVTVTVSAPAATSTGASSSSSSSANLQTFTGNLGGAPPPVTTGGKGFVTNGSDFLNLAAALGRSCDVQHNACANAANVSSHLHLLANQC